MDGDARAETLRKLHEATFGDSAPMPHFGTGWWWLVWHQREPIAFAGLRKLGYDSAYLKRSGVLHAHRGQGLQRRLITARERLARRLGFALMLTDTTDNPASGNTLIAAGYRLFSPVSPWGPEGAVYWRKKL